MIGSNPPVVRFSSSDVHIWTWPTLNRLLSDSRGSLGTLEAKRLVSHLVAQAHLVILQQINEYLHGRGDEPQGSDLRLIGTMGNPVGTLGPWVVPMQFQLRHALLNVLLSFIAYRMPSGQAFYFQIALASYLWRFGDGPPLTYDQDFRDASAEAMQYVRRIPWRPYGRRSVRH